MTIVSDDPSLWPSIDSYRIASYFIVASCVIAVYEWALTFGQEVELIWRQRWSLMTVLYLSVRYLGIISTVLYVLGSVPTISLTDARCWIMYIMQNWLGVVVFAMLWVILISRLYAMYQQSRKILIFLIVTFLASNIFDGVTALMMTMYTSGEALILSATYQCTIRYSEGILLLFSLSWIFSVVWEVFALGFAVWIFVKHLRELRQHSTGGIMEDCFTVLMTTHVFYFVSFVAVSCFNLIFDLSPTLLEENSQGIRICEGFLQLFEVAQSLVLGPRLILGLREYHAKLVADSDTATGMTSIAFQERVHISTGSGV